MGYNAAEMFKIDKDKINWSGGLRITIALIVLFTVTALFHLTSYLVSLFFGVLFVAISDSILLDIPIDYRIKRLAVIVFAGAILTSLGLLIGVNSVLAIFGTFIITILCGATLVWGKPAALAGFLLNIWFIIALILPGGASQALPQGLAWLIGGVIYVLLAFLRFEKHHRSSKPVPDTAMEQSPKIDLAIYFSFFRFKSPLSKFVLIKTLAVTIGISIGLFFRLPEVQWVPIYTLVVLQIDFKQTLDIFLQRLFGTVAGAVLATVLMGVVHSKYLIILIILALAVFGVAMHNANMLIYIFCITTLILLLLDFQTPGNFTVVWARVLNVFIGALLALVVDFYASKTASGKVDGY